MSKTMNLAIDPITLDDKWTKSSGRVVISGAQAIARIMLAQGERDRAAGLNTAGYVTGYRGSPLGNVDLTLWTVGDRLKQGDIVFQPGVNEDLAATAVRGTQQVRLVPGPKYDGVYAMWYAKGPGVDRSGDAFKHGNCAGADPHGGVIALYGDDHAGKSSTVSHQSEQAMAANMIPSLYPSNVAELLEYGLLGFAMSRYSGCWVGIKCVNDVAEQTATIDLDLSPDGLVLPTFPADLPAAVHGLQTSFDPLGEERIVVEHRLPLVAAFVRANRIDRIIIGADRPALGIVTAGKAYGDVRAALDLLGLADERAAASGVSLYKVGCIWPLETSGLIDFAQGHQTLLIVEEKKSFLEQQVATALVNRRERPLVIGKLDEEGQPLLSSTLPLDPTVIAIAIAARLDRLGLLTDDVRAARDALPIASAMDGGTGKRAPYFCSGCPHNRSTRIPDGSLSMTGIGCHTMVNFVRPEQALLPTQMGGEGANWMGMAPFTDTKHIFQNMGDGTYFHSGLLAIRAAVAARINITYKILYNDAVAMTGGQPVDGPISVAEIARQLHDEGVRRIVVLSDDPERHRGTGLPSGTEVGHRDTLDALQRELREEEGCTAIIYEQTCAAEKRRRRKRKQMSDPPKRLFISKAVCEGCGDCSVQSTCVSLVPVETEFGRKRAIDQSSCNKDYSCLNGFCPSFITVRDAELRKPERVAIDEGLFDALPEPTVAAISRGTYNLMVAGIGGTGIVTVGAIVGMAAHLDGLAMSLFDMTGLSQKNGAVYSHVRVAAKPADIATQRLGNGEADVLLAFDPVAALAPEAASSAKAGRTIAIANANVTPTPAFQFDRDLAADPAFLLARLKRLVGREALTTVDASAVALGVLGDTIGTNMFLVGVAAQSGALPVRVASIERAIELNGVSVPFNLRAFRLGRLFAVDPARVTELAASATPPQPVVPTTLDDILAHRTRHLTDYQDARLAARYGELVERVRQAESATGVAGEALSITVAKTYARVLAYKDEYEVARLLTQPALREEIGRTFADGAKLSFNLAPPIMGGPQVNGRPRKREFGPWILPVFGALARFRRLRGTPFDPFGRTADRRTERALIADYEALVERVVRGLTADNHAAAVALLGKADAVRGYGPVKEEAAQDYRQAVALAEAAFLEAAPDTDPRAPAREELRVAIA